MTEEDQIRQLIERWVVTHEHHSFADASGSQDVSAAEISR
ncbi:MAG: hypothetical protein QOK11_3467 [Pseudonocardiales bacterium]|nr:hypothetical protein [Pseudonocardiales bacterium]MDT4944552.1 hypothetical protein [Pseudonocardiales bacterium]